MFGRGSKKESRVSETRKNVSTSGMPNSFAFSGGSSSKDIAFDERLPGDVIESGGVEKGHFEGIL